MSVASGVTNLAARIRDKINDMVPRLIPTGGTSGQALVKLSGTDYDVTWTDVGGSGLTYRQIMSGVWLGI